MRIRTAHALWFAAVALIVSAHQVRAQEAVPGTACGTGNYIQNVFQWSGGRENGGLVNGMFCDGSTWDGVIAFRSSGVIGVNTTSRLSDAWFGTELPGLSLCCGAASIDFQAYGQTTGAIISEFDGNGLAFIAGNNSLHRYISFYTGGAERVKFTSSGTVGIGVAQPEAKLHVAGEIIVAESGLACTEESAGSIRYNSVTRAFDGCNGWGWCALPGPCPRPGPASCPDSGDLCADGSYYIGRAASGTASVTMTATDSASAYEWGSLGTWRAATDADDGATQSAMLAGFGASAHPAAHHCETLTAHGHSDWYLPARNELLLAQPQAGAMALDTSGGWPNGYYWASTEGGDANNAVSIRMQDAFANTSDWKANGHKVRCVRKVPD